MAVIVDAREGGCAWGKGARPAYLFLQGVADLRLQIALLHENFAAAARAVAAGHDERPFEWMAQISAGQYRSLLVSSLLASGSPSPPRKPLAIPRRCSRARPERRE